MNRNEVKGDMLYYASFPVPEIGPIFFAASLNGLCAVALRSPGIPGRVKALAEKQGRRLVPDAEAVRPYFVQVEQYLKGERQEFDLPIDWRCVGTEFERKVLQALQQVKFGEVVSYSDLARQIGKPRSARAVGMAMARNPIPIVLPCHRVIRQDGSLGGYGGGLELKQRLLTLEGKQIPQ